MKRFIEDSLKEWKEDKSRRPMILRGARQVGKSYLVSKRFAPSFKSFVVLDFEREPQLHSIFEDDLDARKILSRIEVAKAQKITPGETLLFFDEAQRCPRALNALRYFYEEIPQLHLIAAGSLLQFALDTISVPVGRVTYRYVTPLSFEEYLYNSGNQEILTTIQKNWHSPIDPFVHQKALELLKEYFIIGGMPAAVAHYVENRKLLAVKEIQQDLLQSFDTDIAKYTKKDADYRNTCLLYTSPSPRD